IVGRGVGINLAGQFQAQGIRGLAICVNLLQDLVVIGRVNHHGNATGFGAMVFGSGTQHGGATDVDVFNRVGKVATGFGNGFTERIQIDHQQVDGVNIVFFHGVQVDVII